MERVCLLFAAFCLTYLLEAAGRLGVVARSERVLPPAEVPPGLDVVHLHNDSNDNTQSGNVKLEWKRKKGAQTPDR